MGRGRTARRCEDIFDTAETVPQSCPGAIG